MVVLFQAHLLPLGDVHGFRPGGEVEGDGRVVVAFVQYGA